MNKKKWIILAAAAAVLILLALGCLQFLGYSRPYAQAANTMSDGLATLQYQPDGSVLLSWPAGENAQGYRVRILESSETELFSVLSDQTEYLLTSLPQDREVEIRIESYRDYDVIFEETPRRRWGAEAMSLVGSFAAPAVSSLSWEIDEDADELLITFDLPERGVCRLYHGTGGDLEQIDTLDTGSTVIRFGAGGFQVPELDQRHIFSFDVVCTYDNYVYTGIITEEIVVTREGLLSTELEPQWVDEGDNVYSVTWNETKGAYYAVEQYDASSDTWNEIHRVEPGGERSYNTGHLPRYSELSFRVVAVGGQTLPDSGYAAVSEPYAVSTGYSVIYSTVWPIKDLPVYADTAKTETLGTAKAADAFCVLAVEGDLFLVRFGGEYGYIDNRYCMINLSEMLGSLCSYDIKNSYDSIYKVHEYDLPEITGEVITGYENVRQNGGGYLVPLLYPVALRLEKAAFAAMEEGYRLKIYDSYRPQKATLMLYDQAAAVAEDPVPGQEIDENDPDAKPVTYFDVMTDNGRYGLNYFLARGGSRHNQGLALDLTLEKLSNGKEVSMQTAMHDLSWYSEIDQNNGNAKKLRSIMTGAGFGGLVSEWWHFQDNEAKNELQPPYLWGGVTAECWMADDNGWRYRTASGKYYKDTTRTIDGAEYTFDENGYVVQPQAEDTSSDAE